MLAHQARVTQAVWRNAGLKDALKTIRIHKYELYH
jgi:hypothetical protein